MFPRLTGLCVIFQVLSVLIFNNIVILVCVTSEPESIFIIIILYIELLHVTC